MIRLVTFDLDNTLWDVTPVILRAERAMLTAMSARHPQHQPLLTVERVRSVRDQVLQQQPHLAALPTRLRRAVLSDIYARLPIPYEQQQAAVDAAFDAFMEQRNQIELFPQTLPLLTDLTNRFALIALSNGNADLRRVGIDHFFVAHFSAETTGKPKPDPAMFQAALSAAGVAPEHTLHIGDHPLEDVRAAQQVGMRAVWFNPTAKPAPEGVQPDAEIRDLSEITSLIDQLTHMKKNPA